jgi:hypothetical protein
VALFLCVEPAAADTIDALIAAMQSADRDTRRAGFSQSLPLTREPANKARLAPALIQLLLTESSSPLEGQADADYIADVVHAVALLEDSRAIPALLPWLGTGNMVPTAMARLGPPALLAVLSRRHDGDWIVRKCVMLALLAMLSPENAGRFSANDLAQIGSALQQATTDQSAFVVETATIGLQVFSTLTQRMAGSGYNSPENPTYRATFSVDAEGTSSTPGALKYSYTRTRMNFVSSAITSFVVSGSTVTMEGVGTVNGGSGYTFAATATDGSPDVFSLVIRRADGTLYYSAPALPLAGGAFVLQP